MDKKAKLEIDVISDVMCPWCYIGKTNLDTAVAMVDEIDVEVRWRPYQLDGTLPKEGMSRSEYLNNKFGGEEGAKHVYGRIRDAGKALGIDFNFEAMEVSPNTLDAHRVIHWAGGQSSEIQNKLVDRLFEIFFLEGGHIGKDEVLVDATEAAGMDGAIVDVLLKGDQDKDRVSADIDHARQMGVTGVPCFIVDNKFAVMGAQPPEQLAEAMRHAVSEREKATS
ncbi:MAG: DsbA family oxidoreductase [Pseudomonadota bacterium]